MTNKRRLTKLLVANRGEIAVRVLRSAKAMGYQTVAVYSDADAGSPAVALADEAVRIGPGTASESYLDPQRILDAAKRTGADALHPGYGFLSENAAFAEACAEAGVTFVGPPAEAIRLMGDKVTAKRRMVEAGVPSTPGYHGSDQDDARLKSEAQKLGVPLLVKATAGGGGRGMRMVRELGELDGALKGARTEAQNAFGNGDLFLERLVEGARHIEIQVFADTHGNVVHLGERECSVQRRHQKVIEEAPSVAVDAKLRATMGDAAVKAAKAIHYVGAGTVEFLLDDDGNFYFLEMNTRLQVEHPVTESVTGFDLVRWQLEVADGERLPVTQGEISAKGHAIEARLYAEDPYAGFMPQLGEIELWAPAQGEGVRIDAGIQTGQTISPFYDAMVAKVIAYGADRAEARRRLIAALRETTLLGPGTNRSFLLELLHSPEFERGDFKTDQIDKAFAKQAPVRPEVPQAHWAVAAWARSQQHAHRDTLGSMADALPWGSAGDRGWPVTLVCGEDKRVYNVSARAGDHWVVRAEGVEVSIMSLGHGRRGRRLEVNGIAQDVHVGHGEQSVFVDMAGVCASFEEPVVRATADDESGSNRVVAPMGGKLLSVEVAVGDKVDKGQCVAVVEAMKMEHRVTAGMDGRVAEVPAKAGDQVAARQPLVILSEASAEGQGE